MLLPIILIPKAGSTELIVGAFFGLVLGFLAQRSRLCVTGAIRDFILFGVTRNLKFLFLIMGTVTFFYTIFLSFGIGGVRPTMYPAGWFQILGGLIFGFGMAIAGGCVVSTFYRIGEGSLNYLLTAISMLVGIAIGAETYKYIGDYLATGSKSFLPLAYAQEPTNFVWLGMFADKGGLLPLPLFVVGIIQAGVLFGAYIYIEKKLD